jgi:Dolichyl-phosphate-mannose-protein mannosyltransferase
VSRNAGLHTEAEPAKQSIDARAEAAAVTSLLPQSLRRWTDGRIVAALTGVALAIRIYLSVFGYCISGDGVAYVGIAKHLAEGQYVHALSSVFPPLYPAIMVLVHAAVPDWELGGDLISAILGGATVIPIYFLMREVTGRRDLSIIAAAITAVDPPLARYASSVRTEAGYVCLLATAVWLSVLAIRTQRIRWAATAGAITGIAYLYRTEAVGLAAFVPAFVVVGAFVWHEWRLGWAIAAALAFGTAYLIIASPYIAYLSMSAGHLAFSRELHAAIMYGMGDASPDPEKWRQLGYHDQVSLLTPLFVAPRLFIKKVASDFVMSFYFLAEALTPVLAPLLILGIYRRGRAILTQWPDALLLLLIAFYFCGFAVSYTGPRFMVHLIPFMFGWIALGIAELARLLALTPIGKRFSFAWCAVIVLVILSAISMQNDSYDVRGVRYAGEEVARLSSGSRSIVSDDKRFAYYAGATSIDLPSAPRTNFCAWLAPHQGDVYVALTDKEEIHYGVAGGAPCLAQVARYPRGDYRYYDLFKVRN